MKFALRSAALVVVVFGLMFACDRLALAHSGQRAIAPDTAQAAARPLYAMADATAGSGSASSAPSSAPLPETITIEDPTMAPAKAFDQVLDFFHKGWALGLALAMYFLLELAAKTQRYRVLGDGRTTLVVGGITGVLGAVLHAVVAGGTMQAVLFAAVGAILAFWHPAANDVAITKLTRASQSGRIRIDLLAMVLAIFAALYLAVGCHSKAAETVVKDGEACVDDKLGAGVRTLGGAVGTLLGVVEQVASAPNWLSELENLALQVGEAAVDCAAHDVIGAIGGHASSPTVANLTKWLNRGSGK